MRPRVRLRAVVLLDGFSNAWPSGASDPDGLLGTGTRVKLTSRLGLESGDLWDDRPGLRGDLSCMILIHYVL